MSFQREAQVKNKNNEEEEKNRLLWQLPGAGTAVLLPCTLGGTEGQHLQLFSGGGSAQHHPVTTGWTPKAQAGLNFSGSGWKAMICSVVEKQC